MIPKEQIQNIPIKTNKINNKLIAKELQEQIQQSYEKNKKEIIIKTDLKLNNLYY